MRILVTGDRNWDDVSKIASTILLTLGVDFFGEDIVENKTFFKKDVLIQGGAKGADFQAKQVGYWLGMVQEEYKADWNTYGKAAGVIRNKTMYEQSRPDIVLAFHANIEQSKGTKHMIKIAKAGGTLVRLIT